MVVVVGAAGWGHRWGEGNPSREALVACGLLAWVVFSTGLAWRPLVDAARIGGRGFDAEFVASLGRSREAAALRVHAYRDAARWINSHAPLGSTVLAAEIGALGYYTPAWIIDAAGLVTPEAVRHLPVAPERRLAPEVGAIPRGLVQDTRPDYVVTLPVFAAKSLLDWPWFLEHYDRVHEVDVGPSPRIRLWGGRSILIFQRVD